MIFRRSVRNSSATSVPLPTPDSAAHSDVDDDSDNRDHYISLEQAISRRQNVDDLESNSTDSIAERYADHRVPNPAANRGKRESAVGSTSRLQTGVDDGSAGTHAASSLKAGDAAKNVSDGADVALPVTTAPSQPQTRPVTSMLTAGSAGGALASVGAVAVSSADDDYLAVVTVDQQKSSSVSCCVCFKVK